MSKPKQTTRPKYKLQRPFLMPKDRLLNKGKRIYNYLLNIEELLKSNPKSVTPERYFQVLEAYMDICEQLERKGYKRLDSGKIVKRVDGGGVAQDGQPQPEAGMGEDGSAGMGTGIPAPNPLT